MAKKTTQTLKGFRDFLPSDLAVRNKIKETVTSVFKKYGFQPLETPTLESQELLLGKYGEEADKLVYTFNDKGDRPVGLRYDLTVPTARVVASNQDKITLPFKRFQIQPVWRADKPQKGRYREFTQCDIDILGSDSYLADAEILAVISDSLKALNFQDFTIKVNSRQVLFDLINKAEISEKNKFTVIQSIDKLDKKTETEVKEELEKKGIAKEKINNLFTALNNAKPDDFLEKTLSAAYELGVNPKNIKFEPSLARGLDYYTGPIFETVVTSPKIGSITGGGRYDNLIEQLGGPDIAATGTTLGLDRLADVIIENNLWPEVTGNSATTLVTVFNQELLNNSLKLASQLRNAGIATEVYFGTADSLNKQLKYANKKQIPYVIIIGENEAKNGVYTLKNMQTGDQGEFSLEGLLKHLS